MKSMGFTESFFETTRLVAEERGKNKVKRNLTINLIKDTDLEVEKIANIVEDDLAYVLAIKTELEIGK